MFIANQLKVGIMKSIHTLPDIVGYGTLRFICLSLITIGVFPLIWLYGAQKRFYAEFGKTSWEPIFPLVLPAITGLFYLCSNFALIANLPTLSFLFDLTDALAIAGLWVYWSFVMRNELVMYVAKHHQFKLHVNVIWLVIFSYFYIIYIINKLPREYELKNVLTFNKD